jgi:hypothetical protein
MLQINYNCTHCHTKFQTQLDEIDPAGLDFINWIRKETEDGENMLQVTNWYIPKRCPICGSDLMKFYKDAGGYNYENVDIKFRTFFPDGEELSNFTVRVSDKNWNLMENDKTDLYGYLYSLNG